MFDKLSSICDRYEELNEMAVQPETVGNYAALQAVMKEISSLEPVVTRYREYLSVEKQLTEVCDLASDPEWKEEAEKEKQLLTLRKQELTDELKSLLTPPDPLENRNVILEIRSGVGGEEAALFAGDLTRMYLKYCDRTGLKASIAAMDDTELGGISSALLLISGSGAYGRMKYESGVHCVKRVPVTESSGRIHTSTATVAVFPEAEDDELTISQSDLRIDVFHASGHGGQGVNTTDSAVRITHLPTGTVVTCQDERSQLENKAKALKVLKSRLLDRINEEKNASLSSERREQIGSGDRSGKIRTYYFNHDYVTDHRIGLTVSRVSSTLNGDLDPFIQALRLADRTDRISSLREDRRKPL